MKRTLKDILLSIFIWLFMLFISFLFIPWSLFALLLFILYDRKRKQFLLIHRVWCNSVAKVYPGWKYRHEGFENIDPKQHYVIVSNHQSFVDILLLSFLPLTFRWTSKRSVFLFPIFGWQFWMGGHLSIVRGSEKSRKKLIEKGIKSLRDGISVLIFPEGTRSKTGEIGPFKPGGFIMALKTKSPILPVVISGSARTLPRNSWIIREKTYPVLRVLPPIETINRSENDLQSLMDDVREKMIEAKKETDIENEKLLKEWIGDRE